jgi:hypothetical protein
MIANERNPIMKKALIFPTILAMTVMACGMTLNVTPSAPVPTNTAAPVQPTTTIPAPPPTDTVMPSPIPATATIPAPVADGTQVSSGPLSVFLPAGLASGARGSQFPRAEGDNVAPWEVTPGHTLLELDGYPLQGKSMRPQIYVYPAQAYAELYPPAFESLHRLDNIFANPGAAIDPGQLPAVPFFNAQQAFAATIQVLSFQNGQGVRFVTEYAQYPVSGNNQDLFYEFQGLTSDGAYYIIAMFPITAPGLAESNDPAAAVPAGGIAYPGMNDPNADWAGYYNAITALLNGASPEAYNPTLAQLDALIQSIRINP